MLLHKFFGLIKPNIQIFQIIRLNPFPAATGRDYLCKFNPLVDGEYDNFGNLVMRHCPLKCFLLDFRYPGCMKGYNMTITDSFT